MGTTSKVYRLNDSECLKYFNYSMDEYDMYRLNKFTNLRFEGANLPNKLVIVNNKFRGYITDFINGETLETFNGLNYSEFVKSASTLLDNVHNISMERIRILDSHEGNIMYNYDKGMLEITDPVEWCFDFVSSKDEIWSKNFRLVNATIRKYLFLLMIFIIHLYIYLIYPKLNLLVILFLIMNKLKRKWKKLKE